MAVKKNISVRLGVADLRRVKEIALRLDVKESEIFRYAVKALSTRLMPLLNRQLTGVSMLVALLESGEEMLRYFEFDAQQFDRLINASTPEGQTQVDTEDIELLVIAGINRDYLATQLSERLNTSIDGQLAFEALRNYLFRKYQVRTYLTGTTATGATAPASASSAECATA